MQGSPRSSAAWQQAQESLIAGQFATAQARYRTLVQQFPNVAQLWAEYGMAAGGDLNFPAAEQASLRAADLAGADAPTLVTLGQQFHRLRRLDHAEACFKKAVQADPSSVHAQLTLAAWYERTRRIEAASECVASCLKTHPGDPQALYFRAFLLHRQKRFNDAESALRDLLSKHNPPPDVAQSAQHLLGVVLDELEHYAEALVWLGKAKATVPRLRDLAPLQRAYAAADQARRALLAEMTPATIRRWREEAAGVASPHPLAFLGGAPRSGTTLLEQILGAHPDVAVFDEPEACTQEILNPLHPPPPARPVSLRSLNALPSSTRSQWVARYFKSLLRAENSLPPNRLLLDKNPSLTASLHISLRLFPRFKTVIMLRDPRDVVVSCYFQNLALTPANVNFLSLGQTARYYGDCMDVWLRLRELGGFDWIETRYEDVVANLETEGRRVTEFLGLAWHEQQGRYFEQARKTFVFAPTYDEVTRPVYRHALSRWKHYEEAMAPLEDALKPYLQAFGYAV